jgi:hypothetical protein
MVEFAQMRSDVRCICAVRVQQVRGKSLGAKPSVCGDAVRASRACDRRADCASVSAQGCSNRNASAVCGNGMAWDSDSARRYPHRRVRCDPTHAVRKSAHTPGVLPMVELAQVQSGVRCGSAVRVQSGRGKTLGAKPSVCGDAVHASRACDRRADCASVSVQGCSNHNASAVGGNVLVWDSDSARRYPHRRVRCDPTHAVRKSAHTPGVLPMVELAQVQSGVRCGSAVRVQSWRRQSLGVKPSVCGDAVRASRACDRRADCASVSVQGCSNHNASAMGGNVMAWDSDSARSSPHRRVRCEPTPVTSHEVRTSAVLPMVELAQVQSGVRCGSAVRVQLGRGKTLGAKPSVCGDAARASCACDRCADCASVSVQGYSTHNAGAIGGSNVVSAHGLLADVGRSVRCVK